jgi:hypothetical protein
MPATALRVAALLAVAAFLVPASGCIRYQEELVVQPDGSGKLTLTMGFSLEILEKLKGMGMDPKENEEKMNFSFKNLEKFEGIVAFSRPKNEKKDNWQTWTVTAYFDDINKVRLVEKDGETTKVKATFAFRKEGDGFVLEIDDRLMENDQMRKMDDMPEEGGEEAWEMVKQFLKGFEMSRGVKMPGTVTTAEGFSKKEGRGALNKVDESNLKNMAELSKLSKAAKRKVVCGKSELSEGDVAAFKKELDDAKAAWPKIQEELKAEAEKKKKDREKDKEKDE